MSKKSLTFINYYQILDLQPSAPFKEIKEQYKKKSLLTHPDKNKNSDAADQFRAVNEAYKILSDKNLRNDYDKKLFSWALKNHDNNIVIAFLNQNIKFNINEKDNVGNTPLHIAVVNNNNINIIKLLLFKGAANIQAKNNDGFTALHYACLFNFFEIADLLIKYHDNINEKDNVGNTPLHIAIISNNNIKLVDLLLNKGADIKIKNKMGDNSLKLSQTLIKNDEVTCLLLEKLEKQTQKKLLSINKKIDDIQEAVKCLQQKKKSWFVNLLIKIFSLWMIDKNKDIQNKILPKNNELQDLLPKKEMIDDKMKLIKQQIEDLKYKKINLIKLTNQPSTSRYKLNLPQI